MLDKTAETGKKYVGGKEKGRMSESVVTPHLQLLHLASPAAAFLTVNAADWQRQDLLLQLRVWVDLK